MEYLLKSDVMAFLKQRVTFGHKLEGAVDTLPTVALDDAISRKDLLDVIKGYPSSRWVKKIINSMPSIQPDHFPNIREVAAECRDVLIKHPEIIDELLQPSSSDKQELLKPAEAEFITKVLLNQSGYPKSTRRAAKIAAKAAGIKAYVIESSPTIPKPDKLDEMILNVQSFCPDINPAVFDLFRELASRLSKVERVR